MGHKIYGIQRIDAVVLMQKKNRSIWQKSDATIKLVKGHSFSDDQFHFYFCLKLNEKSEEKKSFLLRFFHTIEQLTMDNLWSFDLVYRKNSVTFTLSILFMTPICSRKSGKWKKFHWKSIATPLNVFLPPNAFWNFFSRNFFLQCNKQLSSMSTKVIYSSRTSLLHFFEDSLTMKHLLQTKIAGVNCLVLLTGVKLMIWKNRHNCIY